ncbi:hypothetical protein DNK47_02315 [Mycoplasma wenyonii]|uniref:Uncharacterized protein n=1 Tax=Mycoplasma wenyonii TaxID=65123 RepID=A0A328PMK3_9MOLU|nr:hypothetical protein [Mycoplasma wenyonii]RAO94955.1 hypothetical protein DNK47_02315 [Mycoplasma wenyonii]
MTKGTSGKVTLHFKEGDPKTLEYQSPFWMRHFQDNGLNPDEKCELKSSDGHKSPYTLSCKKKDQKDQMIQEGIHI